MRLRLISGLACVCLDCASAQATLVDTPTTPTLAIPSYYFQAGEDGTSNPTYTYFGVPGYGTVTVSYGPFFQGQSGSDPLSPPITVTGPPSNPLSLTTFIDPSTSSPDLQTIVEVDGTAPNPNTEVLGGLPYPATNGFGGPIAILFSTPVAGASFTGGYFDTIGLTTITGYSPTGIDLGSVVNQDTGYEQFNLSDNSGGLIGGLLITTTDPGGFGINGLGVAAVPAPAPDASVILPAMGLLPLLRRRAMRFRPQSI